MGDLGNLPKERQKALLRLAIAKGHLAEDAVKDCSLDSLFVWSKGGETFLDSTEIDEERRERLCPNCGKRIRVKANATCSRACAKLYRKGSIPTRRGS